MYDKIYKEIFLKDFIIKRKVYQYPDNENKSIWEVKIYNISYFLIVYIDDICEYITPEETNKKEFLPKNEAELIQFRLGNCTTEKRIIANRLFLELVKRYTKEAPFLCRIKKIDKSVLQKYVLK